MRTAAVVTAAFLLAACSGTAPAGTGSPTAGSGAATGTSSSSSSAASASSSSSSSSASSSGSTSGTSSSSSSSTSGGTNTTSSSSSSGTSSSSSSASSSASSTSGGATGTSGAGVGLFFSEYVQGSASNKALELTNDTDDALDLSQFAIQEFANGAATATTFALSGSVESGASFVVCHTNITSAAHCDLTTGSTALNFNGNDTLKLVRVSDGAQLDSIGDGTDPGTGIGWNGGGVSTYHATLRRKCSIGRGDATLPAAFDPSIEWDAFPQDSICDLGASCGATASCSGSTSSGSTSGSTGSTSGGSTGGGCGACNAPPDACHATVGTCQSGVCVYDFVEGASCDDGNACTIQDTCHAGTCAGTAKVCDAPPAAVCNGSSLATYNPQGVCNGGLCVYTPESVSCGAAGCSAGACVTDPCASVTCDAPPSACFAATGTCSASTGTCAYDYADGATCDDSNACTTSDQCNTGVCRGTPKSCLSPPASSCSNATTAKVYEAVGSCSAGAGTCSYTYHFVTCVNGCSSGTCNGGGWQALTSNATVDLHSIWGTSASNIWAGGRNGTMLHWDGVQWQARSSGVTGDITGIRGTSASDIFAIATDHSYYATLIHFDGTSWSPYGGLNALGFEVDADYAIAVIPVGPGEAYVVGDNEMLHATGGTLTPVASGAASYQFENESNGSGWAFSPTDVWIAMAFISKWDGTTLTKPGAAVGIYGSYYGAMWAASEQAIFVSSQANVLFWNGTAWTLLNTGLSGDVTGVWGTSANRVFASAQYTPYQGTSTGYVLVWDGVGWTQETIPTSPGLNAIYAAPTGEVFAVGDLGTILEGP